MAHSAVSLARRPRGHRQCKHDERVQQVERERQWASARELHGSFRFAFGRLNGGRCPVGLGTPEPARLSGKAEDCDLERAGSSRTGLCALGRTGMRYVLVCLLALAFAAFGAADAAMAASIEGSWSGGGTVRLTSGKVEAVRCRIRYEKSTGRTFVVHVNCAHAGGTFQTSGRVVELSESRYSGRMYSDQYAVSGDVAVSVSGNRQTVKANSAKGTATVMLAKQ